MSATPRDALGINDADGSLGGAELPVSVRKRLERERRAAITAQLDMLPAPVNEYSIVMPDVAAAEAEAMEEDAADAAANAIEEDALDAAEREHAAGVAAEAALLAKRSSAIQRAMPRPLIVNRESSSASAPGVGGSAELAAAAQLIAAEAVRMLEADHATDPPKGAPPAEGKKKKPLKPIDLELLGKAHGLLQEELAATSAPRAAEIEARFAEAWTAADGDFLYVPSLQKYAEASSVAAADVAAAREQQLHLIKNLMTRDAKKAAKIEKKLELVLGGYRKRSGALSKKCEATRQAISDKTAELGAFEALQRNEGLARQQRLGALEALVKEQREREATLQATYAELSRTRLTLLETLQARQ